MEHTPSENGKPDSSHFGKILKQDDLGERLTDNDLLELFAAHKTLVDGKNTVHRTLPSLPHPDSEGAIRYQPKNIQGVIDMRNAWEKFLEIVLFWKKSELGIATPRPRTRKEIEPQFPSGPDLGGVTLDQR